MTTEKWQLYSQTGIDGTEYGIRIRPGYVVVGFQKEDAKEIIGLRDEVKRLRSERDYWCQLFQNIQGDRDLLIERDARIKELEAENQQLIAFCKDYLSANERRLKDLIIRDGQIERLEAAFLETYAELCVAQNGHIETPGLIEEYKKEAREALEKIRSGGSDKPEPLPEIDSAGRRAYEGKIGGGDKE